ncbi:hypothetical protein B0H16DRAFT_92340 [Mycena metata]|uniref:Uncharacterized protein n=1 Tax=Mycena metata TaxID=1033252 RepID=A0AAD7ICA9_9AGAR|nr:hypothetical protein B0H16DRAFT_92340 [Mycena metata]
MTTEYWVKGKQLSAQILSRKHRGRFSLETDEAVDFYLAKVHAGEVGFDTESGSRTVRPDEEAAATILESKKQKAASRLQYQRDTVAGYWAGIGLCMIQLAQDNVAYVLEMKKIRGASISREPIQKLGRNIWICRPTSGNASSKCPLCTTYPLRVLNAGFFVSLMRTLSILPHHTDAPPHLRWIMLLIITGVGSVYSLIHSSISGSSLSIIPTKSSIILLPTTLQTPQLNLRPGLSMSMAPCVHFFTAEEMRLDMIPPGRT